MTTESTDAVALVSEPVALETEPAAAESESVARETEPVVADESGPVLPEPKFAVAESESVGLEAAPVALESECIAGGREFLTLEPERVALGSDSAALELTSAAASADERIAVDYPVQPSELLAERPRSAVVLEESLGLRLRAAREGKGLTCEGAAQRLRLPVSVLQSLEAERFDRIGHAIYLRSYLTKYLQLLDLPQVLAERVVHEHAEPPPPLVTTGTVSHPRYLFERYSGSALYLILTAVIVVPAVLLAMRAGFDQNLVRVASLDVPELAAPASKAPERSTEASTSVAAAGETPPAATPAAPSEHAAAPLIASMTPFPAPAATAAKPEAATNAGEHKVRLSLGEASWVEIAAADGQKLEYGLLPAGSSREYTSAKALDVRIGNANGASLEIDGKAQDIAPYRHSNVAHFRVADGTTSTAAHSGG